MIEFNNNIRIDFIVVSVIIMLRWSLSESAGHFWNPEELENAANPDFESLNNLQNPGHLSLTASNMYVYMYL